MTARIAHVSTVDLTPRFLLLAQLRALRDQGFEVSVVCAPGPWTAELEAEGIRHVPWPSATRAWDLRADARAFAELVRILRRERFDAVHTHNPKPGVLGRIAARAVGVPCVLNTVHGLYATPEDLVRRKAPVLAAEWVASRFSDVELYQSGEDLAWARRLRIVRPGRSLHLGNGIDLGRFDPALRDEDRVAKIRRELGIGSDELVVGTVGRMVVEKGYRELFAAARQVRRDRPGVRFLAVGDRDLDKWDAIGVSEIEHARDGVVFAGWREDVPDLLGAMDLFVLPSWREGMPRSAIEAAASGLPLILTDIRGCREVIRYGVEGLLVPPRDATGLAHAIGSLLDAPDLRRHMGERARARAEQRFDERRIAANVSSVTKALLARAGRAVETDERVRLRPGRPSDAPVLARMHRASMPTAFLPTLGDPFLRVLYRSLVRDTDAVAVVAERSGQVVGFATAVPSVRRFFRRFLMRDGLRAAIAAVPRLARPSTIRRATETLAHPQAPSDLPDAELLSIAVDDAERGHGIGAALVYRVNADLRSRGVTAYKVLVGADNEPANRFYEARGFVAAGRQDVHHGTPSNAWVMSCRS